MCLIAELCYEGSWSPHNGWDLSPLSGKMFRLPLLIVSWNLILVSLLDIHFAFFINLLVTR